MGIRVRAGKHTTMGAGTYVVFVVLAIFGVAGVIYTFWPIILAAAVVTLVIAGTVQRYQRSKIRPRTVTWAEAAATIAAAPAAERARVRALDLLPEGSGWHWDADNFLVRDSSTRKISGHSWE